MSNYHALTKFNRYSALSLLIWVLIASASLVYAQSSSSPVKGEMATVYRSFKGLQKYLYSREKFSDPKFENDISTLIDGLRQGIHRASSADPRFQNEPGFSSTVKVLNEMLDDARNRFFEGKKDYALWRLKTSANYCISCHTRHEIKIDFSDSDLNLDDLNAFERGEFFLASRQFDRAKDAFMAAVFDPDLTYLKMEALRKWLIVYTRVHPDPLSAISQLNRLRPKVKFTRYEEEEIVGWLESLRRWQNEPKSQVPVIAKAENLIRQALSMNDPLLGKKGTVELLRASSLLHGLLETKEDKASNDRGHVLYLLGLTYSELPFFFVNELPELFLEQCIREYPKTRDAQQAYALYRDIITLGYTGSAGTRLPDDVQLTLRELHDLAYGIPQLKSGV
ncbi:MAG: hypothetical protein K1X79_12650 [Oligoflexia bacterium]|nr:hypothetical protein [Oligoflexia bacterium]